MRAAPGITALLDAFAGDVSSEESRATFGDLVTVMGKALDLFGPINLRALPDVIDVNDVLTAIDVERLPEALATGEMGDVVDFRRLVELIDLTALFQAVDLLALHEEKTEFDNAVADATANLDRQSETADDENGDSLGLRDRLRQLYQLTEETSEKVSTASNGGRTSRSSRNPLLHSTVPATNRPEMGGATRLSTVPDR